MKKSIYLYNFSLKNVGNLSLDLYIDGEIVSAETEDIYKEYWNDTTSISFRTIRNTIIENNPSIVNIYINSPGGNVTEAMATHDFIVELQNKGIIVNGYGYGIIASSSTYILSACKNSYISKNSFYMIHDLSGGIWGTIKDIKNYYETMVTFDNLVKDFYANLTGQSKEQITKWMDEETYFNGTDAVKYGFVKNLTSDVEFTNKLNADSFQFKNKQIIKTFNSLIKNNNPEINLNMNKIQEALENVFKKFGFVNKEGEDKKDIVPITEDVFRNSLNEALKNIVIEPSEEQLKTAVANFFKDGLPENVTTQLGGVVANATKDLPTNEKIKALEDELEAVKTDLANNKGGAKPRNNGGNSSKYEHEGISFDN